MANSSNIRGRYLADKELEQFKINCPACGSAVNLLEFSGHLKEDIAKISAKHVD